ncbi:hypothetical protein Mal4_17910 [Maioricimonas rarisocia]|uniref:PLOD1-3-like GT domain-containing protein n=1 Tax=Maioricimonas rarisocia TaxID=2528026 RepID=A0A517Z4W4_9PLAN|nr:class I SAM-dependent methyltransferase [Maioricimonas rarisocia]QDU37477.1 hypothetical protein Mal4_17910 [Maioricimonas rarisocia]
MVRLRNALFGTEPIVAHCPGPLHEGWHYFADAVRSTPVVPRLPRESATILTWNNGSRPDKPNGLLEQCVGRWGSDVHVLGADVKPWTNLSKLQLTADALQQIGTEYVVGLDSGDVLLVDHPDELVCRFRTHFTCDLLFNSTGARCWPEMPAFVMFESTRPAADTASGRHWLNAGAFVGRTDFCREYFATLAREAAERDWRDDQFAIKETWPRWYPRVQIDYRCHIFQWFNESRPILQIERPRADRQRQLIEWLEPLRPLRFGAEVGVYDGYTSDILLQAFPELHLWMVDPWHTIDQPEEYANFDESRFEELRRIAMWWTSHAEDRRFELRKPSLEASSLFPDASLDFVFIDADHHYDAVKADVHAWWPKVRTGGLLSGHDYGVYGDATGAWGVRRAVDEFAAERGVLPLLGADGTWCIEKQ